MISLVVFHFLTNWKPVHGKRKVVNISFRIIVANAGEGIKIGIDERAFFKVLKEKQEAIRNKNIKVLPVNHILLNFVVDKIIGI